MPSSALKEHTCPSAPAALHPIKTKTTKKKNKNRSGGGNNFDAFFFSFSFNKNEKQCFTLQKASVALANKEKTHGDASVDLKWNFKFHAKSVKKVGIQMEKTAVQNVVIVQLVSL